MKAKEEQRKEINGEKTGNESNGTNGTSGSESNYVNRRDRRARYVRTGIEEERRSTAGETQTGRYKNPP
jgi:hypothetical protein